MAFFVIKNSFDLTDYPAVSCSQWDKPPSKQMLKDDIDGETVKFETVDEEYSEPIANELEIDEYLISAGEKSSVTNVIVAKVLSYEIEGQTEYNKDYWRSRT